jgi:hypothetical protein
VSWRTRARVIPFCYRVSLQTRQQNSHSLSVSPNFLPLSPPPSLTPSHTLSPSLPPSPSPSPSLTAPPGGPATYQSPNRRQRQVAWDFLICPAPSAVVPAPGVHLRTLSHLCISEFCRFYIYEITLYLIISIRGEHLLVKIRTKIKVHLLSTLHKHTHTLSLSLSRAHTHTHMI